MGKLPTPAPGKDLDQTNGLDTSVDADVEVASQQGWVPTEEEDKMLTITAGGDASWWHSCYHNTTAMVGAGVLSLPATFATLLWPGGLVTLTLATVISLYTILQLAWMHEQVVDPKSRRVVRMNRYHQLTQYAFGKRRGLLMLLPFQLMVCVGAAITYQITGGMSLMRIWNLTCPGTVDPVTNARSCSTPFGLSAWIVVFSVAEGVLSQVPNFTKLGWVSAVGAVASMTYSTLAYVLAFKAGRQPSASYAPLAHESPATSVFGAFNAIANIAFAYGGHNMALEIQSTIPRDRPPSYSSVPQMNLGIYVAYAVTIYCYFMVAISGYWAFGNKVEGNVLMSFSAKGGGHLAANLVAQVSVIAHVLASYQVFSFIVYDMIESLLIRRGIRPSLPVRLAYRTLYVIATGFVACLLPFFGDGLVGALGTTPTSYTIPAIVWLRLRKPAPLSPHWLACWATILLSSAVGLFGAVGSVYVLALNAKSYGVFQ